MKTATTQEAICAQQTQVLPRPPKPSFESLDVLRVVACVAVALYHYTFRGFNHDHFTSFSLPSVQFVTKYGYFGVYLFFVISGFVITYSAAGRDPLKFLVGRVVRIYPGFLCCMSISFLVLLFFQGATQQVSWAQWLANLLIVSPAFGEPFIDGVYWSIVCEIVFYAWVLILKAGNLFDSNVLEIVSIWALISVVNFYILHSTAISALFLTKYSGYFCAGMLLHEFVVRRRPTSALLLVAVAIPLAAGQAFDDVAYHQAYYAGTDFNSAVGLLSSTGVIALVGLAVMFPRSRERPYLLLVAGSATYPMYLLHQRIGYLILDRLNDVPPGQLLLGTISGLFVVSALLWHFVERPAQGGLRKLLESLLERLPSRIYSPTAARAHSGS